LVVTDLSVHCEEHTSGTSVNLNVMIFHDLLLTIHSKPVHSVYTVIPRLEYCQNKCIPSIEFVLYVILARVLDYHEAHIDKIEAEAEHLDEQVLSSARIDQHQSAALLGKISASTKRAASLLEGVAAKKEMFTALLRFDMLFSKNGMRYIKSAYGRVLKMHMELTLAREILSDINTLYMSKLNVQLSLVSNEVGMLMKRFGAIGTIFLPLNLIAGIFGMNVLVPADATTHFGTVPHAFITLMLIMIGISVLQLATFRFLKWV